MFVWTSTVTQGCSVHQTRPFMTGDGEGLIHRKNAVVGVSMAQTVEKKGANPTFLSTSFKISHPSPLLGLDLFWTIHSTACSLDSKRARPMYSIKKSSEWEWGPSAWWTIAVWVGRFTHLIKWGNAACKSPDEVIQQMKNRHVVLDLQSPTTSFQLQQHKKEFWRSDVFYSVKYSYAEHSSLTAVWPISFAHLP